MMSSATNANSYILNKYSWMSRQLRNFNDSNSIIQWSNAMLSVKKLLLQPQEADFQFLSTLPTKAANTISNNHPELTISRPGLTNWLPAAEPCHSLSRTWNANFQPQPPSPLTICTSRELSIPPHTPPDVSASPPSKRRKTILPPEADSNALALPQRRTAENSKPTTALSAPTFSNPLKKSQLTTIKLSPGTHIWYGSLPRHHGKTFWAHRRFNGSEAYIVIQDLPDPKHSFRVEKLTTGMKYNIILYDENRLRI